MIVVLYLFIGMLVGYFIGNINFARIFSWAFAKKDITTVGSKNPGTMNMLRTRGFGEAFLTLIMEAIKSGVPALASYFLIGHFFEGWGDLAYYMTAFGVILGHCFPVFYKFRGGKGIACTVGMFLFNPDCWWFSLVIFVICFVLSLFIDYMFVISLTFASTLTIYACCVYGIQQRFLFLFLILILVVNIIFVFIKHRTNFQRLFNGTENKVHIIDKLKKKKTENKENDEISEEKVESNEVSTDEE
ncbi:MAG: glycerol-3-phosphate acyltransferase [Clostridia bacterium]|nr:glycerol-3-phosphate acyltransferase [Clostridia bacterium]